MTEWKPSGVPVREPERVRVLVADLAHLDPTVRMRARTALVEMGNAAVPALVMSLHDPQQQVRWEAAKALESIADTSAVPALISALHDEDEDVRWVAADALILLGGAALFDLLGALIRHSGSFEFSRSAHHVLHDLAQREHRALLTPVIQALDSSEPGVTTPPAALKALRQLTFGRTESGAKE